MFEKDDDDFPIKCPNCFEEFYEKVGRIKTRLDAHCPNPQCRLRITYGAEQLNGIFQDCTEGVKHYLRHFIRLKVQE